MLLLFQLCDGRTRSHRPVASRCEKPGLQNLENETRSLRGRMQRVITVELATRLRNAGMRWSPTSGDRFVVPDRDLDDQVFVVSEMTVEPQQLESGAVVRFNGTTEWALDSIEQAEVIWLPHEGQLRALLGRDFQRLEVVSDGFAVELRTGTSSLQGYRHVDIDAERAYARALLAVLEA